MKVLINEEQQNRLKLAPFIYKAISTKRTSLGDNPAFPPYGEFGFEYDIIKKKYEEIDDIINEYIEDGRLESKDTDYLLSILSKKVKLCKQLEEPIKPQLQKLCENIVNKALSVPYETVIFKCKLVGKIKPKKGMRILPEGDSETDGYDFEDVDEVDLTNKVILKRRFINSLIQGIAYQLSTEIDEWYDTVQSLNEDLWDLWQEIKDITDYLLFVKEENISEKNPMQMSYVEVKLGKRNKKTEINAQGIIFPYLLRDSFRGFLELFSSHGLPEDNKKAMYIIRRADFLVAEPWDLRMGMSMMNLLNANITNKYQTGLLSSTNRIPFFFTELCSMQTDEFNDTIKNFLLGTKKGKYIASKIDFGIKHDIDYQKFKNKIQQKNIEKSLISDEDFSKEELDNYVIQENKMDEIMAYHGTGSDFDKFNHKKYLNSGFGSQAFGWGTYVSDDRVIADDYVKANKENPGKNFMTDVDITPYLKSLGKYDDDTISDILKCFKLYVVHVFTDSLKPTFENAEFVLKDLIDFKESELNCYLPLDKVIEMYKSSKFDYMPEEEKERQIRKHAELIKKKEKPIIPLKACLDVLYHLKPQLDEYIKNKKSYLYEVDIPDDNGFNYLSWYDKPTNEQQKAIKDGLDKLEKRFNRKILTIYSFISGKEAYEELASTFIRLTNGGGYKAASLFLMQCGFDGIKYPAGTRWQKPEGAADDAMNYVIFDANKVKIINKTQN